MTKITDIPAIRFKGFSDTWEQRKLGDVVDVRSGKDYKHLSEGNIPVYGTGGFMLNVNQALSYDEDAIGIGRKGTIDKPYILKAPFWTVDTLFYAIPREKVDLNFAFDVFQNIDWKKKDESTGVPSLSKTAINEIDVLVPQYDEQQPLGQFFNRIDNLITLHQRKYDKLTNVKKSMLEKMFPQNGSNVPEIRFKGFTEAWEQRKVREVTDRYDNLRIPVAASLRVAGTTPYYGANGIQDYVDGYTHDGEFILVAEDGANDLKNYPVKCVKGRIWVNNHAHVLQGKYDCADNQFLAYAISQADIESLLVGGGRAKLNAETLMGIDLLLPNKAEQIRIGKYLAQLDNLITLHQREFAFLCKEKSKKFRYIKNAWEQRKFGEVFDCTVPNNTLSRAELSYDEGTVLNVHYGDVLIKYGSVLDVQKDDIPRIPHRCREDFNGALLQDGDVIIADTAEDETTGKACEIGNLQGSAIVSGLHTMVCRPRNRMALGYLGYYLNSNAYHHQLLPLMQGIKVLSLSRSNIQKTSVSYPSAMKEQQLIASYFSQLDHLITLHQRKPNFYTGGYYAE